MRLRKRTSKTQPATIGLCSLACEALKKVAIPDSRSNCQGEYLLQCIDVQLLELKADVDGQDRAAIDIPKEIGEERTADTDELGMRHVPRHYGTEG